ncbi:MAG TPA: FAD-dependent oxidoreductase [Ktedonobacteraceae bacterium]|nr:FAD-dependent oxidoreductase [Ktedonobacteraceae bacterium]
MNASASPVDSVIETEQTTCCIVGSGPAGAMLALLLARKGIPVVLLEEHGDFDRDFRGDTIHPSTMQILDQLGLAEQLLALPHTKVAALPFQSGDRALVLADFRRLKTRFPYIVMLPQVRFLEFITAEAKSYPDFRLVMGARAEKLLDADGVVRGVRYRGRDGWHEVRAMLTVAADGRFSRVRQLAGFETVKTAPPMDVLWFRLPRRTDESDASSGRFVAGHILIILNRGDYWQVGYIIPKGGYQKIRAAGLDGLRQELADIVPQFADRVDTLQEWKQIAVLSVESSRLMRWYRPGLLLIGDAAHVMSPVAGVGINYAIQDAVTTANILDEPLKAGRVRISDLAKVQSAREWPTRIIQALQNAIQRGVVVNALASDKPLTVPLFLRFLLRVPLLRTIPARLIAFGPRTVRVRE